MADLTIKLSDSDFDIFGLPCQFELDSAALSASYLRLQNQTHPDRFANSSAQEKRLAVQWATRVNEAYKRLQNPMERAWLDQLASALNLTPEMAAELERQAQQAG